MSSERTPILYDADCGFCRASLALVLLWDRGRRLRPVDLRSAEADVLLGGMPEERRMASWHLIVADGVIHSAGAAAAPLLRLLPWGRPLARAAERFPTATERAYGCVAARRSALGRAIPLGLGRRAAALIEVRS
ncbi:MAG: DCC1-like thiol-disulfide oxidoreductase family protein [Thermoleophilaceae bacterium]